MALAVVALLAAVVHPRAEDRMNETEGQLRVWHIANPPGKMFQKTVKSIGEAKVLLNLLADYDSYLGDDLIYANAQGLEIFDQGEWVEWHDENDDDISRVLREEWDNRHSDTPSKT
jgi:Superinfection exclusion gene product 17